MWAMAVVILFPFFELGFDVDVIDATPRVAKTPVYPFYATVRPYR